MAGVRSRQVVIAVLGVAGVGFVSYRIFRASPGGASHGRNFQNEYLPQVVGAERPGLDEVAAAKSDLLRSLPDSEKELRAAGFSQPAIEALTAEMADVMDAYWSGTPDGFNAYLREAGVEPFPAVAGSTPEAETKWKEYQAIIAASDLDLARARLRVARLRGQDLIGIEAPTHKTRRDDARPQLRRIPENQRREVLCSIPGLLTSMDGIQYEGSLDFVFTLMPDGQTWLLTETRIVGNTGVRNVGLPL